MMGLTSQVIFWVIMFFILGVAWYRLDKSWGAALRRWWHNLTHKKEDKLPEEDDRGLFIYKRSSARKFTAATVVSTIQSLVVLFTTEVNLLVEFILWVLEIPVTMIGFHFAAHVMKGLGAIKRKVFPTLDKIERGETTVGEVLGDATKSAAASVAGAVDDTAKSASNALGKAADRVVNSVSQSKPVEEPKAKPEPEPELVDPTAGMKPEEMIRQYTDRRKRK